MRVPSLQIVRRFVEAVRSYAHVKYPILLANARLDYESLIHNSTLMGCDTHRKTIGCSKVILLIWNLFGDPHYLPAQILTTISLANSIPRLRSLRLRMALVLKPRSPQWKSPSHCRRSVSSMNVRP